MKLQLLSRGARFLCGGGDGDICGVVCDSGESAVIRRTSREADKVSYSFDGEESAVLDGKDRKSGQ